MYQICYSQCSGQNTIIQQSGRCDLVYKKRSHQQMVIAN